MNNENVTVQHLTTAVCSQRIDRDSEGKFVRGNQAARSHGGKAKHNLYVMRSQFTDDDIRELAAMLWEKARSGDLSAAKLLLAFLLPQPSIIFRLDEKTERQEERERLLQGSRNFLQ